jgi:hypothetical protein
MTEVNSMNTPIWSAVLIRWSDNKNQYIGAPVTIILLTTAHSKLLEGTIVVVFKGLFCSLVYCIKLSQNKLMEVNTFLLLKQFPFMFFTGISII